MQKQLCSDVSKIVALSICRILVENMAGNRGVARNFLPKPL